MTLIHRTLLQQFLRTFFIFFTSFTGLYVVIDAFNNLDALITYGEANHGVVMSLITYYSPRTLFFFDRAAGMLILISAMFTIASFQRHNELTALLAAGVSERRVVQPLIVAAIVLSGVAVVNREVLIPSVRDSLSQDAKDLIGARAQELQPTYDNESEILLSGKGVVARDLTIEKPTFFLPKNLAHYGAELRADRAVYQEESEGRPAGYRLVGLDDAALREKPSLALGNKKLILSPYDTRWLAPDEAFVVSHVTFEQLTRNAAWRQYSSTYELITALHNPSLDFGANVRVAIHARLVQPFLDVTLFFLGLPLVITNKNRRNTLVSIGQTALVVAVFMCGVIACQYLGSSYLVKPSLAAWLPLILFVPAAVWLYEPLRDKKATA